MNSYPLNNFAVRPLEVVRIGFIGLGSRGIAALERYTHIEGVRIAALCDFSQEAITKVSANLDYSNGISEYSGEESWKRICENPNHLVGGGLPESLLAYEFSEEARWLRTFKYRPE